MEIPQNDRPPHPEIREDNFEAASDMTKQKLFALVKDTLISYGVHSTIPPLGEGGSAGEMRARIFDLKERGKLELVWSHDELGERATILKTDYLGDNDIAAAMDTMYELDMGSQGIMMSKMIMQGNTPSEEENLHEWIAEFQQRPTDIQDSILDDMRERFESETKQDLSSDVEAWRAELEVGMNSVGETEAQRLIELVASAPQG